MSNFLRLTLVSIMALAASSCAYAQMRPNQAYQAYISQYKDIAIEQMLRYNIPASITLAQGLLESSAGRSELATRSNNHFGIKCHGWTGRRTYHDDDMAAECFRAYDNARQSYEDHSRFLSTQSRYARLFSLKLTDYRGWAHGLKQCGYATNPQYASKLIGIVELYQLNRYDKATSYDHFMAKVGASELPSADGTIHVIKAYNDNYYIIARKGDTFDALGHELGISARRLAKYNERNKKDRLSIGDVVYLKKKRTKAEWQYKHTPHTVQPGESMYAIAQKYGVRLKSLYKKNNLSPDYEINVGDQLRVY